MRKGRRWNTRNAWTIYSCLKTAWLSDQEWQLILYQSGSSFFNVNTLLWAPVYRPPSCDKASSISVSCLRFCRACLYILLATVKSRLAVSFINSIAVWYWMFAHRAESQLIFYSFFLLGRKLLYHTHIYLNSRICYVAGSGQHVHHKILGTLRVLIELLQHIRQHVVYTVLTILAPWTKEVRWACVILWTVSITVTLNGAMTVTLVHAVLAKPSIFARCIYGENEWKLLVVAACRDNILWHAKVRSRCKIIYFKNTRCRNIHRARPGHIGGLTINHSRRPPTAQIIEGRINDLWWTVY